MLHEFILQIPEQIGLAVAAKRKPQPEAHPWPKGTRIVSADSHILESDLWIDRFPEHLKDQAPRMQFRGEAPDHVHRPGLEPWLRHGERLVGVQAHRARTRPRDVGGKVGDDEVGPEQRLDERQRDRVPDQLA